MTPPRFASHAWVRVRIRAARILRSSIFRLALLYVLLLGSSVAILLGFIYWSTAGYMDRQTTATIEAEIRGLAEQYPRGGLSGLTSVIGERVARDPVGSSVYLLVDDNLERVVGNLDRWPPDLPDADGWIRFRLREWGADHTAEHEARAKVFSLRGGLRLLVGRDVRDLEATRALIREALTWGLAITAALALLGSWLMSASLVRRLEAVNQTSRDIMEGDLSRRIALSGSGDDFDRLAVSLNRMLERIETLMASVRQVSDNIAHDLRTPLTRLRNKLELLKNELADGAARTLAEETIADADEMLTTFNALLRIARIESGSRRAGFGPVNLVPLIEDLVELYEPVAAERGQVLDLAAEGCGRHRGGSGSPVPGDDQSGRQRRQIHPAGRPDPSLHRRFRRTRAGRGRRQRSRHPRGTARAGVSAVLPGRRQSHDTRQRAGPEPGPGGRPAPSRDHRAG